VNDVSTQLNLSFRLDGGEALDVRAFEVKETIGAPFFVRLTVMSPSPDLDLEGYVGEKGRFSIDDRRAWGGIVRSFEHVRAEPAGLSTYGVELVPELWLLTERRNHRIFQRMTEPEMALRLLREWGIPVELRIDQGAYKKRDYRVQYAESDFAFMSRMLEDSGITYWFETGPSETTMVLSDAPHTSAPRAPLDYVDDPTAVPSAEYVTAISIAREIKPGRYTVRDVDHRLAPTHALLASAAGPIKPVEDSLEQYHYVPGAFLFEGQGDGTPVADDKMAARSSESEGQLLARRRLDARRSEAKTYRFRSNALDLRPGMRLGVAGHARSDLRTEAPLLLTETSFGGEATGRWWLRCEARTSDVPFRPRLSTPKPKISSVETAVVVGAPGDEIHTDELGRVRVHFHWDRDNPRDDGSSCWIPVSHPWAGTGYGGMNLPRVGQEVVVSFVGGDPDRPMVTGRVYTSPQPVPYKLPENKTQSGWRSNSTNQTGGYNEIMFEDAAGKELMRVQAERDLHHLVKHDEERVVGNDRIRQVKRDEDVQIGNDRVHRVGANERIHNGQNRAVNVGVNRATQVGAVDSLTVGETFVVNVSRPGEGGAPSPSAPPPPWLEKLLPPAALGTTLLGVDGTWAVDTGKGARVVLKGDGIYLVGKTVDIVASDRVTISAPNVNVGNGNVVNIDAAVVRATAAGQMLLQCSGGVLAAEAGVLLSLAAPTVWVNGPGKPAARKGDDADASHVLGGSSTVEIGDAPNFMKSSSTEASGPAPAPAPSPLASMSRLELMKLQQDRAKIREDIAEMNKRQAERERISNDKSRPPEEQTQANGEYQQWEPIRGLREKNLREHIERYGSDEDLQAEREKREK